MAGLEGIEPPITGSKPAVIPLHHSPIKPFSARHENGDNRQELHLLAFG